jgi:hypothetical protein
MLSDHLSSQSVRLWDCTMPIANRMKRILAGWRIRASAALRLRVDQASRYEADGSFGGQRKPSMTPAIELRPYSREHRDAKQI